MATAHLLLRVVSVFRLTDVGRLIDRIKQVGQRLCAAQPRELVIGNIVRRVLGLIREELEADREGDTLASSEAGTDGPLEHWQAGGSSGTPSTPRPGLSSSMSTFSPLRHGATQPLELTFDIGSHTDAKSRSLHGSPQGHPARPSMISSRTSYAVNNAAPLATSMFDLLSSHDRSSPAATPPDSYSPRASAQVTAGNLARAIGAVQRDLKPDIIGGIEEIIEELSQVDDQIAAYAPEYIHSNEIILTHSSSLTVQTFLLRAAAKRKFTVIHAESFQDEGTSPGYTARSSTTHDPDNDSLDPDAFRRSLTTAGVTVIVISDSAAFALMSRVNKVILGTHAVLANGGLVAAVGARMIARAAKTHRTPVVVVSGVYKLSPVYPFDFESLIEYGDVGRIFPYQDGEMVELVDVENPLYDYVPADLVDLYITNLFVFVPCPFYHGFLLTPV